MDKGAERCEVCGTAVTGVFADDPSSATGFLDTVHLRTIEGEPAEEKVVRPSLAILFRVAVGPAADYYAPRFLEYERRGYSFPSWNWAAPWAPTIWAFYHKLWGAGLGFALWPVAAMAAFGLIDPYLGDSTLASVACAILLLWVLPGVVAGLIANTLIYHSTREVVRRAEAETLRPDEAAKLLGERSPIALGSAVVLGVVAINFALLVAAPNLQTAVADRAVRTRVAEALKALEPTAAPDRGRMGLRAIVAGRARLRDLRVDQGHGIPGRGQREPRERPRAPRAGAVDSGAYGAVDTARADPGSRRARALDLCPGRYSHALSPHACREG